ncbi:DUF4347 domain-containing protein [Planktothrix mougeotii]|uniref:DUF4347 domain-containing protein n=1 Tax=Planktothrix mougeotii LEGE 06226 TaxID=1828728 RepID=A0ABR9UIS8_9CYAN|nr:DUF4347 domain-containing protein [Planktothrix mougeotii]MBE9146355.1 DUF4347 domain-containing protein [Planktothrix mougeotii LEGE 06226]
MFRLPDSNLNSHLAFFSVGSAETTSSEIAFFAADVPDLPILLNGLMPGVEAIILDANGTELQQIADILKTKQYRVVHIFSHGKAGEMGLGKTTLTQDNIYNDASIIREWKKGLASRSEILLYGSNIAKSSNVLITILSELTEANITVSNNFSSNLCLEGDWGLEVHTGSIKPPLAIQLFGFQSPLLPLSIA